MEESLSSPSLSFCIDNVKTEKRNAMLRYRRLRNIGNLFRFLEVCLALAFISWFSTTRLPIAVKISGDYFRHLCVFIVSPRFVFLLGNAIILTLFAKSAHQKPNGNTTTGTTHDLYDDYIDHHKMMIGTTNGENSFSSAPEEIIFEDKKIDKCEEIVVGTVVTDTASVITSTGGGPVYRRSKSEKRPVSEKHQPELRRTETDLFSRNVEIPERKKSFGDDQEMSNEEFQRKIEAFIAKQMRFHREESMAIVFNQQNHNAAVTTTASTTCVKIKV